MPEMSFNRLSEICCAFLVFIAAMVNVESLESERDAVTNLYQFAPTDQYGIYKYAFKTSNGIAAQAAGSPLETFGIFSYTSPEGTPIEVRYIGDELGFHAVGDHIPEPPPIPKYILRSLKYIFTHPNQEDRARYRVWK